MTITIPTNRENWLFTEPKPGYCHTWQFRWKPVCERGEEIIFRIDVQPVALGKVMEIIRPGEFLDFDHRSHCWSVVWDDADFFDLRQRMQVCFSCNEPANGTFTGEFDSAAIEVGGPAGESIDLSGPTTRLSFRGESVRVGRRVFPYKGYAEWVGNWCWDSVMMLPLHVRELLTHLRARGFHCEGAPSEIYDMLNSQGPIDVRLLVNLEERACH